MLNGSLTGSQIRAARAVTRWTAATLAERSGVGIATIKRAESVDGQTSMTGPNVAAIRAVLEAAGVKFIGENGGGPGVRLREPTA